MPTDDGATDRDAKPSATTLEHSSTDTESMSTLAIVVSEADEASEHIGEHCFALADWERVDEDETPVAPGVDAGPLYRTDGAQLRVIEDLHLETEGIAASFDDPDLLAFASRHAGETGPLLTAHHTGNFGDAEFGGADGSLARACPNAHRRVLAALYEHAPEGYDVGMECTHHGPSDVGVPSMFVEVGSGPTEWTDPAAARAVANAILDLRGVEPDAPEEDSRQEHSTRRHLVGFGGGHYAPRFERVVRETDWAVGHVAADWALDEVEPAEDRDVIEQAFEASAASFALLEDERPNLRATIEDLGYRVVDETWVRETDGVDLGLVARLEDAIASIDDGLRLGSPATEHAGEFVVVDLLDDLLERARGIDADATLAAVADVALAFDTEQSGTQVTGPFAVAEAADRDALVEGIAGVLRQSYDAVERDGDELVAREQAFDPKLARDLGVPEGPKFGQLADGTAIDVDGRQVEPSDVTREREERFDLSG